MNLDIVYDSTHFDLLNSTSYAVWRENKLSCYSASASDLLVAINDFNSLSSSETEQMHQCLNKYNMVIYSLNDTRQITTAELCKFATEFGLKNIDGNLCSGEENVSTLTVQHEGRNQAYIPYTNKPISWHTDGYYNSLDNTVRSFILHCTQAANIGGENSLIDPEIVYILLRDENPEFISVLMENDVMTIPENIENGVKIREQQTGPVFSVDTITGKLHMRYTARTRSIEWKKSEITQQAVSMIQNILLKKTEYSFIYKLKAGQGLLCNNVLHNRTAFEDTTDDVGKRELLRARYFDRIKAS